MPPGQEKPGSPFLTPPKKANLPPDKQWIRDYYDEISSDMIRRVSRLINKTMQPAYQFPPFYHTPIDMLNMVQVNAGGNQGTILTLTIPHAEKARIKLYWQDITPVVAPLPGTQWNDVVWSFSVNGNPLEFYQNFRYQRGTPMSPAETTIILEGSQTFTITGTNNNAAGNNFFLWAAIKGWRWSPTVQLIDEDLFK